ncbi:hypothetical protein HDE_03611 [Halotydeus destructor]|nr:hypothetical protein HDE_03611 [Halotydeus destructor]
MDHGPVFMSMELVMTQARQRPKYANFDILDSLGSTTFYMTKQLLKGLGLSCFFTVCSHFVLSNLQSERSLYRIAVIKFWIFCWSCLKAIIRQEYPRYAFWCQSMVWWTVCQSLFVAISGYALNQLSTDAVVTVTPIYAETVQDLLDKGNFYDVHISSGLFFIPRLKLAPPSSLLGRLYRQVERRQVCPESRTCYLGSAVTKTQYVTSALVERDPRYVSLLEKRVAQSYLRCLYPYFGDKASEQDAYMSQAPIAETMGITAFRNDLPYGIYKYLFMRLSFILEFGLEGKLIQEMTSAIPKNKVPGFETDEWDCLERPQNEPDKPIVAFAIEKMSKTIKLVLISCIISFGKFQEPGAKFEKQAEAGINMQAAGSTNGPSIAKLEGANWRIWKLRMEAFLKARELLEIVSDDKPAVCSDKWTKQDAQVQYIILTSIDMKLLHHIESCASSSEMWQKLVSVFEKVDSSSKWMAANEFHTYSYQSGSSMADHVSHIQNLVLKLSMLGTSLEESIIVAKLLQSVPERYSGALSAIGLLDEDKKTFERISQFLIREEGRIDTPEVVEALVANGRHSESHSSRRVK